MGRNPIAILLLSVACSLPAQQADSKAEVIKFRGAYLGQPLSDYADCSTGKAKAVAKGYHLHGALCARDGNGKGIVFHTRTHGVMTPTTEGEIFDFEKQSIVRIRIEVPNEDWEKVRYDLSEKMGPPLSEVPQVFQNGFGARWEFEKGFWRKGNVVAYAGMNVNTFGGCHTSDILVPGSQNRPCAKGIRIVITTPERAGAPDTRPNSLE